MSFPVIYHPDYVAPLPAGHRFPMAKFSLLHQHLLAEGIVRPDCVYSPELPPREWIEWVHEANYVRSYCEGTLEAKAVRRIGLPWTPDLARRTCRAVGGTILTAKLALECGIACNTAGGTHHAYPEFGSGFCIFNDLAIAARWVQQQGLAQKVLIVDLDVHQGDGTAAIFRDDPTVFTFSMHCGVNFPARKQPSDLDVSLAEGMEDDEYLQTLGQYLPDLLASFEPDLVLYDAGVDTHAGDRLGKLALSDTGLFRREMQVLSSCVGGGYPVACVIGGGYADDMQGLVYRHGLLHRVAAEVVRRYRL